MVPPVVHRAWESFKRFSASVRKLCKKYEAVISVLFSVLPVIGQFLSKTIIQRVAVAVIGLSAMGLVGIANQEAFVGKTYKDSVGIETIGYGFTEGVKPGQTITPERALVRLLKEAEDKFGTGIKQCIKVPLYQNEYDAYISLAYNIGVKAFCESTLAAKLNQGDYSGACAQISRWNRAGGEVSRGLTNRRRNERAMCEGL